ncbi:MAG: alcohol dehydrogenase catalytic domain-containing protein [Candidatus Micrarchaeaceae archaeon]
MKALLFERQSLEALEVKDVEKPKLNNDSVLIRVKMAGVNPIDYKTVTAIPHITPMPHIPGAEFAGEVAEVGSSVSNVSVGDRVTVYNRRFDGVCRMCKVGMEQLCTGGYIIGVGSNGGFAEYAVVDAKNVFKIGDEVNWELAASLPVSALTAYHAINEAGLSKGETAVILGASGNTGLFAVQFAKAKGAEVIAVSRKNWVGDFGPDHVVPDYSSAIERVKELTGGAMANVVLNSLGERFWDLGIGMLGYCGRMVGFGTLSGNKVSMDFNGIYSKQIRVIGSTGGTIKEFKELVSKASDYRTKVWKRMRLEEGSKALAELDSNDRDGRIILEIS